MYPYGRQTDTSNRSFWEEKEKQGREVLNWITRTDRQRTDTDRQSTVTEIDTQTDTHIDIHTYRETDRPLLLTTDAPVSP